MAVRKADPETARNSQLAAQLRTVTGKIRRRLLVESDGRELTASQIGVLLRLEQDGPASISALAKAEGMRPQSMGAKLTVLETLGLVTGARDPEDGRQAIVCVTPLFNEWIAAGRAARQGWLFAAIRQNLTAAEQNLLASALKLLERIADA